MGACDGRVVASALAFRFVITRVRYPRTLPLPKALHLFSFLI